MIKTGKKIKFISLDKVTRDLFEKYKSNMKVSMCGFDQFLLLYEVNYAGKTAEIIKDYSQRSPLYVNYYTISINGETRAVFCELIKYFTNVKNHITLDDKLFKL